MIKKVKVYLGREPNRRIVEAEVVQVKETTMVVKLPDGNKIVRKIKRDLVKE